MNNRGYVLNIPGVLFLFNKFRLTEFAQPGKLFCLLETRSSSVVVAPSFGGRVKPISLYRFASG